MKRSRKWVFGMTLVIASMMILSGCGKQKFDLKKDYTTVTFSGADGGYGTVDVALDTDALEKSIVVNEDDYLLNELSAYEAVESIEISAEPDEGLSNGDKVTVTLTYPENLSEFLDAKITPESGESWTVTVKGLEDVSSFDPFEGVELSCSGFDGDGTAEIKGGNSDLKFKLSESRDLSNGDTVTVTIDANSSNVEEYCINELGKVPVQTSKEYKVTGLASYVTSISEIPEDTMAKMQQQAEDERNATVAQEWGEDRQMNSFDYLGSYFLTPKSSNSSEKNRIYLVYKVDATDTEGEFTYYRYICFSDIAVYADGTGYVDITNYELPTYGWWSGDEGFERGDEIYTGFEKLSRLKDACVTSNLAEWTYDSTVKETEEEG